MPWDPILIKILLNSILVSLVNNAWDSLFKMQTRWKTFLAQFKLTLYQILEALQRRSIICIALIFKHWKVFTNYGFVWILLIAENWKYYIKTIFKCVNSTVRSNFNKNFAKFHTCESCEQCMRPTV